MTRISGTIVLVLLVGMGCRRDPAPAPTVQPSHNPVVVLRTNREPAVAAEPTPTAEQPAKSESDSVAAGGVDRGTEGAAGAQPASPSARSSHRDRTGGKRSQAARVAAEQQEPQPKHRAVHKRAHKVAANAAAAINTAESADSASPVKAAATEAASEQLAAEPAARPDEAPPVHATLSFKNEAGDAYKLAEARFTMDGAALPTVVTSAGRGQTQRVFSGDIPPGRHVIAAHITYHGADRAIFTYMKGYTFKVQSDDTFVARKDEPVSMTIVCKEKEGFNQPVEKRLTVSIEGDKAR